MSLFNRLRAIALCALTSCVLSAPANAAISFDIDGAPNSSASASLGASFCLGCTVSTTLNPALDSIAFSLNPGESSTFDFFRISVGGLGLAEGDVSATLAFDIPAGVSVPGNADGFFITFFGILTKGALAWNDVPQLIVMGDGSSFSVDFSDVAGVTHGSSANVTATVTAITDARSAVPEPTMLSLLGLAALGLAAVRRGRATERRAHG